MAVHRARSESPRLEADENISRVSKRKLDNDADAIHPKRQTKRPKDIDDQALDDKHKVNHAIAHMDSILMADHIAQRTKRFRPDMSVVESDDVRIPASAIRDTTSFNVTRTTDQLAGFVLQFAGSSKKASRKLSSAPTEHGSPHTLIIAAAGLRAADLTRAVRSFQTKDSMVAKLFAKHIKLKDAAAMVSKTRIGIGVGTPQRISDLMDNGALSLKHLERIIIDASHIDQKKRGILDMKEVQIPLVDLLSRREIKDRFVGSAPRLELLFF